MKRDLLYHLPSVNLLALDEMTADYRQLLVPCGATHARICPRWSVTSKTVTGSILP